MRARLQRKEDTLIIGWRLIKDLRTGDTKREIRAGQEGNKKTENEKKSVKVWQRVK